MHKLIIIIAALLLCSAVPVAAQMSDSTILSYIVQGVAEGKDKSQIGQELLAKGVTMDQVERLLKKIESQKSKTASSVTEEGFKGDRRHTSATVEKAESAHREEKDKPDGKEGLVFGHNLFNNTELSFEPNDNMATPAGYILGPGDEVIIDVWGMNEASISQNITPEGVIFISQVGPVQLAGLSIEQATGKIRSVLSKKYSLSGEDPESQVSVTLGKVRSITVNILGEVKFPGTYRLSSLSSVFNALHRAGGIKPDGSLRNVQVFRSGKFLCNVDLYEFIFYGRMSDNVSLADNDLIIVPLYTSLVEMQGGVKRPMIYEAREGEAVARLVDYAGGFAAGASKDMITVQRKGANNGKVFTVNKTEFLSFAVCDGDIVTVYSNNRNDLFDNRVEIRGMVMRPGFYAAGGEIATVRQLVEHAGGLLEDAFHPRAQLIREKADRSLEIRAVPIGAIMDSSSPDVLLHKNDILIISNINEINTKGNLTINGYVNNPGEYKFAEDMTIEDLILLAGGLENGASSARVNVSRRIIDNSSESASDTLARVWSFSISEGLVIDADPKFTLQPFDIVSVYKSPSYVVQKKVRVSGEITFPGEYTLVSINERVSDIYVRAGKHTPNAYVSGAIIKRKLSEDERNVHRSISRLTIGSDLSEEDSIRIVNMNADSIYTIGINMDKAIEQPGSEYDIVLHDGDELIIPSITNTVRIQGEVLYPNSVTYKRNASVAYYVKQAGGFSSNAKRRKVYVVHMNGTVSVGKNAKVDAGSVIVVPSHSAKSKLSTGEWLAIGSTTAAIATMIATVVNATK